VLSHCHAASETSSGDSPADTETPQEQDSNVAAVA
jgi:hypothetical protein